MALSLRATWLGRPVVRVGGSRIRWSATDLVRRSIMGSQVDLGAMRKPYKAQSEPLLESELPTMDPVMLFKSWFEDACRQCGLQEPNAMVLCTADRSGRPSARMVLLKGFGKEGFCFYTNYNSRKGKELESNPQAALLFYWEGLSRQIRIEGTVEHQPVGVSEDYFHSRPRGSQLAAVVSEQSTVVESRNVLLKQYSELQEKYASTSSIIPKPEHWGGYRLKPAVMEFWQGQTDRMHDRIRFRRPFAGEELNRQLTHPAEDGWVYERLAP